MGARVEILDEALADVVGTDDTTMTDINKKIKNYITKHKLEEVEGGKKYIYPDDLFAEAFGIRSEYVSAKDFWFKIKPKVFKKKVNYYTP